MSNFDLKTLCSIDLQKLPTEALESLESAFAAELQNRQSPQRKYLQSKKFLKTFGSAKFNQHLADRLHGIIDEDWSHLFSGDSNPIYYVYVHLEPGEKGFHYERNVVKMHLPGIPFFVGSGSGRDAYNLSYGVENSEHLRTLANRYKTHKIVHIIAKNLTQPQALELESKLIFFFGTKHETTRKGILRNLVIPTRPF